MSGRSSAAKVTPIRPGAASKPKTPARPGAALPADLRNPPEWLSAMAKREWRRIVPRLDELYPDALSVVDVPALGLMLEHHAIAIEAAKAMRGRGNNPQVIEKDEAHRDRLRKTPASQVLRDHGKAFVELADRFGLTFRGRIGIDLEKLGGVVTPDGDDDDDLFDT